jgi:hypothetical protein
MTSRRKRANRWLAIAASVMVALGSMLVIEGAASAATPVAHFPVIRFWTAYHRVTLDVPARAWCPKSKPKCVWELFVNEPDIPAQTVVGIATGSSGVLMVDYPAHFCGVLQADAIVGPSPWLLEYGHQKMIKTGSCDPHTTTTTGVPNSTSTTRPHSTSTTTTRPRSTTTTTKPKHHVVTTTTVKLPFTSSTTPATVGAVAATAAVNASTTSAPPTAQLPFTGADVRPLAILGTLLIIFGIYILTTLEQRRRVFRRMSYSMRSGSAAGFATRTTRWFLGE